MIMLHTMYQLVSSWQLSWQPENAIDNPSPRSVDNLNTILW